VLPASRQQPHNGVVLFRCHNHKGPDVVFSRNSTGSGNDASSYDHWLALQNLLDLPRIDIGPPANNEVRDSGLLGFPWVN